MRIAAIALFTLLAATGATALNHGVNALAIPMILAGLAGATVALATQLNRWVRPAQATASATAALLLLTGILLAPTGPEQTFVISVNAILAALIVAFTLLAPQP